MMFCIECGRHASYSKITHIGNGEDLVRHYCVRHKPYENSGGVSELDLPNPKHNDYYVVDEKGRYKKT